MASGPACSSQERICSAATRLTFSPGMMRRTRSGAVQLEQRSGTCDQPGVVPAGHNGLAMGMAVRMVVVAALWAGFGVTARPDTRVDGIPGGLRFQGIRGDQPFEPRQIHGSGVERIVETAPPTLAVGRQAQMRWRFEGRCAQHGVERLEQGVASTPKQRVHLLAEGSERFHFWLCSYPEGCALELFLSTPPGTATCCWLKCKMRGCVEEEESQEEIPSPKEGS